MNSSSGKKFWYLIDNHITVIISIYRECYNIKRNVGIVNFFLNLELCFKLRLFSRDICWFSYWRQLWKIYSVLSIFVIIWKLQLKYFSYQRDQRRPFFSTLICISKSHYLVRKNSKNAGVNWAEKAYQCIVYTPMKSRIASNPRVYL